MAMKRPSEVPPLVEARVSRPVMVLMLADTASSSAPGSVRNGRPDSAQSMCQSRSCLSRMSATRCCRPSTVDSVEKRKLNTATRSPGITLVAPVPELTLEIWKLVGGKNALPLSQCSAASSARAGAARWIGFFARCG
ncbi:hypothetical protein D3C78_1534900 [compost metagenome]